MYRSPGYVVGHSCMETTAKIVNKIKGLYHLHDVDGNDALSVDELEQLIRMLLGGSGKPNDADHEEVQAIMDAWDKDHDGNISLEEIVSGLLRLSNGSQGEDIHRFKITLLDPNHTPARTFVHEVEQYCLQHEANKHHVLRSLAVRAHGDAECLDICIHFMKAYRRFTSQFCTFLSSAIGFMADDRHKAILRENMDEENGIYDRETLEKLEAMGLDVHVLQGLPTSCSAC